MLKYVLAITVTAYIALVAASIGRAATLEDCSHNPASAHNVIFTNAEYGFKPYLLGLGQTWWRGKERAVYYQGQQATVTLCGDQARQLAAGQTRFYVMLRAFPAKPTRAQWKARFRSLMQAAIALDAEFLPLAGGGQERLNVAADKAWLVAAQNTPYGGTLP